MVITFHNSLGLNFSADCRDPCMTETLDGAEKTVTFSIDGRLYGMLPTEAFFYIGDTRYKVKDIIPSEDGSSADVECIIDLPSLEGIWVENFTPPDLEYSSHDGIDYGDVYDTLYDPQNVRYASCAQDVISGMYNAGFLPSWWLVRFLPAPLPAGAAPPANGSLLRLNGVYEADKMTALEAIRKLAKMIYGFGGSFDIVGSMITFGAIGYGDRPYGHSTPFIFGHNLRKIVRTESSRGLVTRLYAYGKDGLDLSSVCDGKKYVDDFSFTRDVIADIWTNTDIDDASVLKQAAKERLSILSRPTKSYSADVIDLASSRDNAGELAYKVGEYGLFTDASTKTRERMRIVKTVRYLDEPEKNTMELSSPVPTLEDFDEKVRMLTTNWEKITNSDGSINGVYVHGVRAGDVVGIETVITQAGAVRDAVVSVINDVIGS